MNDENERTKSEAQQHLTEGMCPQELEEFNRQTDAMFEGFEEQLHRSNLEEAERIAKWKGGQSRIVPAITPEGS